MDVIRFNTNSFLNFLKLFIKSKIIEKNDKNTEKQKDADPTSTTSKS